MPQEKTTVDGKTFVCPGCKGNVLEEIMTDVVQSSSIDFIDSVDFIDEPNYVEYVNTSTDGGTLDRIQCMRCGFIVVEAYESPDVYEELLKIAKEW